MLAGNVDGVAWSLQAGWSGQGVQVRKFIVELCQLAALLAASHQYSLSPLISLSATIYNYPPTSRASPVMSSH